MQKVCYLLAWLDENHTITQLTLCGETPWEMTRNLRAPAPVIVFFAKGEDYGDARQRVIDHYPFYAKHLAAKFPVESFT